MVTHGHTLGQRAVGVDDRAGELVSQHGGERDVLLLASLVDANVGAAQQRCVHSEHYVTGFQRGHRHFLDPQVVRLMQHRLAQCRRSGVRDRLRCSEGVRRGGHEWLPFKLVGSVMARRGWTRSICAAGLAQFVQRGRVGVVVGDQAPPRRRRRPVVELVGDHLAPIGDHHDLARALHHQRLEPALLEGPRCDAVLRMYRVGTDERVVGDHGMEHLLGFGSADRLVHRAQPAAKHDDRDVLVCRAGR